MLKEFMGHLQDHVKNGSSMTIHAPATETLLAELKELKAKYNLAQTDKDLLVTHTLPTELGGMVEGKPTSSLNYLQRIRELRAIESAFSTLYNTVLNSSEALTSMLAATYSLYCKSDTQDFGEPQSPPQGCQDSPAMSVSGPIELDDYPGLSVFVVNVKNAPCYHLVLAESSNSVKPIQMINADDNTQVDKTEYLEFMAKHWAAVKGEILYLTTGCERLNLPKNVVFHDSTHTGLHDFAIIGPVDPQEFEDFLTDYMSNVDRVMTVHNLQTMSDDQNPSEEDSAAFSQVFSDLTLKYCPAVSTMENLGTWHTQWRYVEPKKGLSKYSAGGIKDASED